MAAPVSSTQVYRLSEGYLVFPVWQSIRDCPVNKPANLTRIAKALAKAQSLTESEVMAMLGKMTDDGLIIRDTSSKTAVYSLPDSLEDDGKQTGAWSWVKKRDCYCYECHSSGEVLPCTKCPRVFHPDCIRPDMALDLPLLPFREPVPQPVQNNFLQVYG